MASGDLKYIARAEDLELSVPQVQKLRVFLDSGIWDGDYELIQNITIVRQSGREVIVSVSGGKSAPKEDLPFPVEITGIEP